MTLPQEVGKFIEKESLFTKKDHLLVAVSGGVDSMTLVQILHNQGYKIGIAHVNYKLRGKYSELDYQLVQQYCAENKLTFHHYCLTQEEKDNLKSGNLQEKARQLRYDWFKELAQKNQYDFICTAHHQSDHIETFLLNAIRGSGITGLTSMKSKNGLLRRPFLEIPHIRIQEYALQHGIPYRNDLTNFENDYDRNYLRNEILNKIENRLPKASTGLAKTMKILKNEVELFKTLLSKECDKWIDSTNQQTRIGPLSQLIKLDGHQSLLFHILSPYGYNASDLSDILRNIQLNGRQFINQHYSAEIRNDFLILHKNLFTKSIQIEILNIGDWQNGIGTLSIVNTDKMDMSENRNVEYIDSKKIKFPLYLKTANINDRFYPIGLNGKSKKLNDFLKDQKISNFQRKSVQVLSDKDHIIWVIGYRLDERFKITSHTQGFYKLEWIPT